MDKRTKQRLEAMTAFAHHIGANFGREHGDWSRDAIERVAPLPWTFAPAGLPTAPMKRW